MSIFRFQSEHRLPRAAHACAYITLRKLYFSGFVTAIHTADTITITTTVIVNMTWCTVSYYPILFASGQFPSTYPLNLPTFIHAITMTSDVSRE